MTRESNPSIGADCHWSSPLPSGIPSITSTITTVRASSFSAMRCAVVAPTLPAPTTVILFTIILSLKLCAKVIRAAHVEQSFALCSAAHLRQRAKSAHAHLQQMMLARLDGQRLAEERLQRKSVAERRPQIDFLVTEQTRS